MGGSDSPLLQLSLILDLGEEAELSYIYLGRDNLSFRRQGGRTILVEIAFVIKKYCLGFRHAFSPKVFFVYIISFYAHTT